MTENELELLLKRNPSLKISGAGAANDIKRDTLPPEKEKTPQKSNLKQTKCEMEYGRMLELEFPDAQVKPWGVTLRMSNGHKYTPDFLVNGVGWMLLVEVKQRGKNGFRQQSYQRAKVAFDQCRVEFHNFIYRWAEKCDSVWHETKY